MRAKDQARAVRRRLGAVMGAETGLLEIVLDTNRATNPGAVWRHLDPEEREAIKRRCAINVDLTPSALPSDGGTVI